jgi:hypothetical protein
MANSLHQDDEDNQQQGGAVRPFRTQKEEGPTVPGKREVIFSTLEDSIMASTCVMHQGSDVFIRASYNRMIGMLLEDS